MSVYLYKLTPWELDLLGVELTAAQRSAGEELGLRRRHGRKESPRGARVADWPELHTPAQGGTAGHTVDLAPLWGRAYADPAAAGCVTAVDLVGLLATSGGGLARRLQAGLQSMHQRRDGNVVVAEEVSGDVITVTMWSESGSWSGRAWWARADLYVAQDAYGEVRIAVPRAEILVGSVAGEFTRFTDRHVRHCVIGEEILRAYKAWLARGAIRRRIDSPPPAHPVPPPGPEEFVRAVQALAG